MDMKVLKLNIGNETLDEDDQATLDAYYDCHSLPGSQQSMYGTIFVCVK